MKNSADELKVPRFMQLFASSGGRRQEAGGRRQEAGGRSQKSEGRSQKSEVRSQEPGIWNL